MYYRISSGLESKLRSILKPHLEGAKKKKEKQHLNEKDVTFKCTCYVLNVFGIRVNYKST
ncbi:hypothetical protein TSUD_02620 [Trifolium subterraneum]|uniref:Uncharacterized protein n=1 Tax=Trifolium subterraneum TaxID=3900 RepID=A0A2Z6MT48_TRISU|nr:hypothetical protein TSUD_02620 [Trifolium subterraneum]